MPPSYSFAATKIYCQHQLRVVKNNGGPITTPQFLPVFHFCFPLLLSIRRPVCLISMAVLLLCIIANDITLPALHLSVVCRLHNYRGKTLPPIKKVFRVGAGIWLFIQVGFRKNLVKGGSFLMINVGIKTIDYLNNVYYTYLKTQFKKKGHKKQSTSWNLCSCHNLHPAHKTYRFFF